LGAETTLEKVADSTEVKVAEELDFYRKEF
jgi:hypothetical protein